jgi:phosphoglycolate phosphatase-like HAD superfamily hydrolase
MVRLVLFDIDGTLIRTGGAGVRAFGRALLEEFGIGDAVLGVRFAGRTDSSLVREILSRHGIEPSPENARRFYDRYVFWLDHLLAHAEGFVCEGVGTFLAELRTLNPPPLVGLLTGNIRLGAEVKLRKYGLWSAFAIGAFGDDHEDRNRLAGIARDRGSEFLGRNLVGEEIVVVGDTPADVACGQAIQARTLAVTTGGATREELLRHHPDWLVAHLGELQAASVCR